MSIRTQSLVTIAVLLGLAACSADKSATQSAGSASQGADSAPLGLKWADADKMPDLFSGMWMTFEGFVEGDEKLNVPYTEQAQKFVASYKHKRDIPYAEDGCKSPGLPISMRTGPVKFTYAPGLISIYMQATGHTRFIRMNEEMGHTSPKYYGNSVGHWEGDTLVVETKDFLNDITFQYGVGKPLPPENTLGTAGPSPGIVIGAGAPPVGVPPGAPPGGPPGPPPPGLPPPGNLLSSLSAAIWGPHGENMHMVERMRIANPETLEVDLTIYDDTVWTKPYVTEKRHFKRIKHGVSEIGPFNGEPEEWVCTVSITSFDPATNTYVDKDPEEMVKMLDKSSGR
jgi:hypothetical protein